ncbi:MAG TPA: ribonuclease H-like domain-containing protein [Thermaerobacter sp.]
MSRLERLRELQAQGRLVIRAARPAPATGQAGAGPARRLAGEPEAAAPARPEPPGSPATHPPAEHLLGDVAEPRASAMDGSGRAAGDGRLPLEPLPTPAGRAWRWRRVLEGTYRHGDVPIAAWWDRLARALPLLAAVAGPVRVRAPAPPAADRLLFLDLETTGLSRAAGHHAFLAGLAWFETDGAGTPRLACEQFLLPSPEEEPALLAAVARRVEERPWLVTFNGRGFDWPVLEGRWRLAGLRPPQPRAHFDLLYPARRLFGAGGLPCTLRSLEQRRLGFQRRGDVEGAEIPARYLLYLQEGDESALLPVFRHNFWDLLSLAGLAADVLAHLQRPPARARATAEAARTAREWERADRAVAAAWYERALALARTRQDITAVAGRLVALYRSERRWAEAVALQAALCDADHPLAPVEPWLQLARLWLNLRDWDRATACLDTAERLLARRRRLARGGRSPLAGQVEELRALVEGRSRQQRAT